jgi:hypothetical protein
MNESEKQFSFTRVAPSTSGRAKKQFLISNSRIFIVSLFALLAWRAPSALAEPVELERALLAHLPFTEDLRDHSVQTLAVKMNGLVELRAEGAWFSGDTNWLALPYLPLNDRSFTFAVWLKITGPDPMYGVFQQYEAVEYNRWLHLMLRGGRQPYVGFLMNDAISPLPLPRDDWVHVVFQYNKSASRQEIWMDGKFICARASSAYEGKSGETVIGGSPHWSNVPCKDFIGFMRDVRIYGRALTAGEISAVLVQSLPRGKAAAVRPSSETATTPVVGKSSFTALAAEVGIPFLSIDANKLVVTGEAGQTYELLYTDELGDSWKKLTTLKNPDGHVEFRDASRDYTPRRFYRIKVGTGPPD